MKLQISVGLLFSWTSYLSVIWVALANEKIQFLKKKFFIILKEKIMWIIDVLSLHWFDICF